MRRNSRFGIFLLIFIMLCSTLLSGASSTGIASEKVKVIIAFHEQPGPSEEGLIRAFGGTVKFTYSIVPAIAATVPAAALEGLARNPKIKLIEPDGEIHALEETLPWGVDRIYADEVQAGGNSGEGIKVAVIDSGIDYNHEDLIGQYHGGKDFVNNDNDPMDDNGHGTHVSGTIAAIAGNGIGVVGVAPEVEIYALKVLNESGSGSFSSIIAALQWCTEKGIQVTNNSYGSSSDPGAIVQQAFDNAYGSGILHIASAGNSGKFNGRGDNVGFPAQYASVMAVAATDSSDTRAYFSSTGPTVEISAPGVAIYSTVPGDRYESWNGTSMASPHVAGVAALVMASDPDLSNAQVRARLNETALDLGATGRDTWYGYGLVDAKKAVGTVTPPDLNAAPVVQITSPVNGASFDYGATISFSGSASDDHDGNLTSNLIWTSNLQTGSIGTGGAFSTVLIPGTHTITASVSDVENLTGSASINITVKPEVGSEDPITVANLEGSASTVNKNFWKATVTATIDPALSGAVVTGTWSTGLTASGTTVDGTVTFLSGNLSTKTLSSVTFTVDNIELAGYYYSFDETSIKSVTVEKP